MHVTRLSTYPLKSASGLRSDVATITSIGLEHDRRWVLLDDHGQRVSARECRALLGIRASPAGAGLRLTSRDGDVCDVAAPRPGSPTVPTRMSRIDELVLAGSEADSWLSERLGRPVRLAHLADLGAREIGSSHGGRHRETMSLADAGPVLLASETSIDRLCELVVQESGEDWLERDEALERFRPNIVIDGDHPFAEDGWHRVRIGHVTYRVGELCDRCVLTTIDPDTLATGKEPIRTLARHRRWDGATWFGVRLIPEMALHETSSLHTGDEVELIEPRAGTPRR